MSWMERTTAEVNISVRTLEEFRRGIMVVKIKVVEMQWLNSHYASQIDTIGLGNGLDVGN